CCHRAARKKNRKLPGSPLLPRLQPRPPAAHISAIFEVVLAKLLTQSRLFVENNKKVNAKSSRSRESYGFHAGCSKHDPQPDPSHGEAHIHRISHIAIKSDNHQALRRNEGRRRAASRPAKVPEAAQRHGKPQDRRGCGNPSPALDALQFNPEAEPRW